MITKENIEAYLLDFLEGNLNTEQLQELDAFLAVNPSYRDEFELIHLEEESLAFTDKENLKKNDLFEPVSFRGIEGADSDKMMVAALENELSESEATHFNNYLQSNSETQTEWAMYQQTLLVANSAVVYPNLNTLKRKHGKVIPLNTWLKWSAAASIVGIGLWLFVGQKPIAGKGVAQKAPVLQPEIKKHQTVKGLLPSNSFHAVFNTESNSKKRIPETPFTEVKDAVSNVPESVPSPIEMASTEGSIDTLTLPENVIENNLPTIELAENNTTPEKIISPLEFVNAKVKKRLFGKENPTQDEMYESISNRISSAAGISFSFKRKKEHRSFHLRIGKFSIDKN